MAAFIEEDNNSLDWRLLRESSVSVYCDQDVLSRHLGQLARSGYAIVEFDCAECTGAELTIELSAALGRPLTGKGAYLDSLDDVLYDPGRLLANIPSPGGLVFVLRKFDRFTTAHEQDASAVLSILARHSRAALMLGLRWIIILHVSGPDFRFQPIQLEVKLNIDEASMRANSSIDWSAVFRGSSDDSQIESASGQVGAEAD